VRGVCRVEDNPERVQTVGGHPRTGRSYRDRRARAYSSSSARTSRVPAKPLKTRPVLRTARRSVRRSRPAEGVVTPGDVGTGMTAPQRPWDVQARLAGMEGQETRALLFHKSSSARDRIADPPDARSSSISGLSSSANWCPQTPALPALGGSRRPLLAAGTERVGGGRGHRPPGLSRRRVLARGSDVRTEQLGSSASSPAGTCAGRSCREAGTWFRGSDTNGFGVPRCVRTASRDRPIAAHASSGRACPGPRLRQPGCGLVGRSGRRADAPGGAVVG
jgi:hypothetical protein